jgi:LacI family transcriptional regulator, galactose operon repressor
MRRRSTPTTSWARKLATELLLALGHRRIAMLTERADLQSAHMRERGFAAPIAAEGIAVEDAMLLDGGYDAAISADSSKTLLTAAKRSTAIATLEVATSLGAHHL